jgi:catechol 2,3-dioxygenase-like lactoylglutathione lyase family enzyme
MIGYVTLGSNDIPKAGIFYDALLAEQGAKRMMEDEHFIAWSPNPKSPALSIITPFDGNEACVGNGNMVALIFDTNEKVDSFHAKALELGGTDEGAPGPRGSNGFYAGYFRDLDGNKLCAFCYSKAG